MKILNAITIVLFIPITTGCQETNDLVINSLTIIDSIELVNENTSINNYSWRFSTSESMNLIGFVDADSIFYLHDLETPANLKTYPLPQVEGQPFYNVIKNNNDYYYVHSIGVIYKLNEKSEPKLVANLTSDSFLKKMGLMVDNVLNLNINPHFLNDSIIIVPVKWDLVGQKGKYANYKKTCPLFVKYNLNSKTYNICNVWSDKLSKMNIFLRQGHTYNELAGENLLISHPYSSIVQVYNTKFDKIEKIIVMKSSFQTDSILPISKKSLKSSDEKSRYTVETAFYGPIVYNNFRDEYYRVFYHALPRKNENGDFTIYQDKASSILVYDKNMNFKQEIFFEKNYYIFLGLTPIKEGLILNSETSTKNGQLFVKYLNFEK